MIKRQQVSAQHSTIADSVVILGPLSTNGTAGFDADNISDAPLRCW